MTVIEGYIHDLTDRPLSRISVELFQRFPGQDTLLTSTPQSSVTDNEGYFKIILNQIIQIKNSQVYLAITDSTVRFTSVRDSQSRYRKEEFFDNEGSEDLKWKGEVINNQNNRMDIVVVLEKRKIPETHEAVVIGSGFGDTIAALYQINMKRKTTTKKRNSDVVFMF